MNEPYKKNKGFWQRLIILPAVALIYLYKWFVSPILHMVSPGSGCRYLPTCSSYALEALQTHGLFKGCWLAGKRIATCHPWGGSGYDPVPEKKASCCSKQSLNVSTHIHG